MEIDAVLALLRSAPVPEGMVTRLHARLASGGAIAAVSVSTTTGGEASDAAVLEALGALGRVQEPMYLKQRLHERLAREPISSADQPAVRGWMPWAALSSVAAGLVIAVGMHLHPAPLVVPAPAPTVAAKPAHPAFVPEQRTGRGAALNTNGVVATARARNANGIEEAQDRRGGQHRKTREAKLNGPPAPPAIP